MIYIFKQVFKIRRIREDRTLLILKACRKITVTFWDLISCHDLHHLQSVFIELIPHNSPNKWSSSPSFHWLYSQLLELCFFIDLRWCCNHMLVVMTVKLAHGEEKQREFPGDLSHPHLIAAHSGPHKEETLIWESSDSTSVRHFKLLRRATHSKKSKDQHFLL